MASKCIVCGVYHATLACPPRRVKRLARGMAGMVASSIPGPHICELPVIAERERICGQCPYMYIDAKNRKKCERCGCHLMKKTKLKWENCPIGLW